MSNLKVSIISGSHRINSQSEKISRYIKDILFKKGYTSELVPLAGNTVPLWEEEALGDPSSDLMRAWTPVSKILSDSEAFVVVCPEWAGMVPPGLKNLFLLASSGRELSHKPALIVSVSAGINGAYPVSELRMSSYKNSRICFIPEHVIVRNVGDVCNQEEPENDRDESIRTRMDYALDLLISYGGALKHVREESGIDFSLYPNGM
jgi:NAD(P)H-dependent FMN reductase